RAAVLPDNSVIVAGKKDSGGGSTVPALLKLDSDLVIDGSFGNGGVLTLPTTGGQTQTGLLRPGPDGTVTVSGDNGARIFRVFADDRPVATVDRVRAVGDDLRFRVSIRGVHPIDTSTLDDNDLRLVDSLGRRTKLRLVDFVAGADGDTVATYRVNAALL